MTALDNLIRAVILDVWGEEPCGIADQAVRSVFKPEHRNLLEATRAEIHFAEHKAMRVRPPAPVGDTLGGVS